MDKNGRLPLQLNIDTSFLYRDTLVPHPGIVKPSLCISRPGGLGLGTLPPVVTPTIISHLPRPTIHESNNNAGPLPIPRKDAKTDVEVKKSNSSCKNPSPVGNDVCELQVTVTPLNPFMLSTGPSSCSIIGSTTHNIRIYNNNNSDVYTNSYQRRTKHFPQAYIGAPKDGKCAVCKVVPFQFHHFGAFVCNRCRAFFRRTVRRERRGCNLAPCLMTRKVVHNPYTHEPVCDIGVFRGACQVIFGVDSKDLIPLEDFTVDVAVCLDAWVGMVRHIKSKIRVKFLDGSICTLEDHVAEELEDVFDKRDDECEFKRYDFYPGQILKGPLKLFEDGEYEHCTDELKNARNGGKVNKLYKVTVIKAEVTSLGVHWQCRAYTADNQKETLSSLDHQQPKYLVTGEDLKRVRMLNVFEPCTLQIGDRNFYTLKEEDIIMMREEWRILEKESFLGIGTDENCQTSSGSTKSKSRLKRLAKMSKALSEHKDEDVSTDEEFQEDAAVTVLECVPSSSSSTVSMQSDAIKKRASRFTRESESSITGSRSHPTVTSTALRTFGNKKRKKLRKSKKMTIEHHTESHMASVMPGVRHVKPGDRVVVETICTKTQAEVVWQDGTVEDNIPSRELFPIHALDEQEFFPGDCVVPSPESLSSAYDPHTYGVVENVDHTGRTAKVQWFRTYTTGNNPKPKKLNLSEEPVYDLRDHSDFKYRPGSVVIRVANFPEKAATENEEKPELNCFGGQVLDNCTSGEVSVWWVDGSISNTWPQDLYKIGEYDSDEGELWDEEDDEEDDSDQEGSYTTEGSWETESEKSAHGEISVIEDETSLKTKLAANVEKARIAMTRLQEIFQDNPSLQTGQVMKQLLDVYKDGKDLDRLLGTDFFDESNFDGLVEKLRERSRVASTHQQAVHEQVTRLFSSETTAANQSASQSPNVVEDAESSNEKEQEEKTLAVTEEVPTKMICAQLCLLIQGQLVKSHEEVMKRYGGQAGAFTAEDLALAPGEEEADLESIMNQVFKISMDHFHRHLAAIFPGMLRRQSSVAEEEAPVTSKTEDEVFSVDKNDNKAPKSEISETGSDIAAQSESENVSKVDVDFATPVKPRGSVVSAHDISATLYGTPEEQKNRPLHLDETSGEFLMLDTASLDHKFKLSVFQPTDPKNFIKFLRKEIQLLRSSLPQGIHVKGFEDRMDLFSVMIKGPERTPYEDGLFFFDMQLPPDYPKAPPIVHYHSYCSDRLNPNLYEDGKVCVSLLGTWSGKGTETWTPNSNLLQLLVSIQGLILVREPYFNEAGYERQKGSQQGIENSRMYNEMALLKLVQSLSRMAIRPPEFFKSEVKQHFRAHAQRLIDRLESWRVLSLQVKQSQDQPEGIPFPDFPLIPASKGFCISLHKSLDSFKDSLKNIND